MAADFAAYRVKSEILQLLARQGRTGRGRVQSAA